MSDTSTTPPGDDEGRAALLTVRDLVILAISLVVGLLSGCVSFLTVAAQAGVAAGAAAGVVALVLTGLVVATSLHRLLR
ncbi:hypothetical protein ACLQ28_03180 [Micromonospora sp. DT201]|uniref:hypothetical protein n=1 Tax=Micromonospora sp. DT201 TaxID=3393442 RepID=UPI003CF63EE2